MDMPILIQCPVDIVYWLSMWEAFDWELQLLGVRFLDEVFSGT